MKPEVPIATEAIEDYSLNSKSLSRMENDVLQYALKCFPDIKQFIKQLKDSEDIQFDMTSREWKELEEKIDK